MTALFCHATHVLMLIYFVSREICFSVLLSHVTLRCLNGRVFSVDVKNKIVKKLSYTVTRVKKKKTYESILNKHFATLLLPHRSDASV